MPKLVAQEIFIETIVKRKKDWCLEIQQWISSGQNIGLFKVQVSWWLLSRQLVDLEMWHCKPDLCIFGYPQVITLVYWNDWIMTGFDLRSKIVEARNLKKSCHHWDRLFTFHLGIVWKNDPNDNGQYLESLMTLSTDSIWRGIDTFIEKTLRSNWDILISSQCMFNKRS